MKSFKYLLLVTALCAGLSSIANAHFTGPTIQDIHPDNPTVTLAAAKVFFNDPNLTNCIDRVDGTTVSDGFTITFNENDSATITWVNLTDTFVGIYVKGGNQGGQFYGVSADEAHSGTGIVFAPDNINPKNGKDAGPASISHIDFFCTPGTTNVPDSGATAMLLGSALAGLGVVRRYLKR